MSIDTSKKITSIVIDGVEMQGYTPPNLQSKSVEINQNGVTTVIADEGYDGLGDIEVIANVDTEPNLQEKTVTENGYVTADEGYDGLGTVFVNVTTSADEVIKKYITNDLTGQFVVPSNVTTLGQYALAQQTKITDIVFHNKFGMLSQYALYYCSGLKRLEIPNSIHTLGNYSCAYLTSLEELYYDGNLESYEYDRAGYPFIGSTGRFIIGPNTSCLPSNMFSSTSSDINPNFSSMVNEPRTKSLTIYQLDYNKRRNTKLLKLWLDCGEKTLSLQSNCFYDFYIKKVFLNHSNTITGKSSSNFFYGGNTYDGKIIKFGNNVTIIGAYLFYNSVLLNIYIPENITAINGYAFNSTKNMYALDGITINRLEPPTLDVTALQNTKDCPIYVPAESVDTYKTATNWSAFENRIVALEYTTYADGINVLTLGNNLWFDMSVNGAIYNGTYKLTDTGSLTLNVFDRDSDAIYTGTITDNIVSVTIDGTTYTLSLEA